MRFNSAYYAAAAAAATAGVGCAAFGVGPQQQQPQFRSPRLVAQRAASFRGQVSQVLYCLLSDVVLGAVW